MRLIDAVPVVKEILNEKRHYQAFDDSHFADALIGGLHKALRAIEESPTIDAVPVVRCKDCTYYHDVDGVMKCHIWEVFTEMASPPENGYCHCGKRKWTDEQ